MSLNWDMEKVKDWEVNFPDEIDARGESNWNGKLFAIIHYSWFCDVGNVTVKNHVDFYQRIKIYEKVFGCLCRKMQGEDYVECPITYEDVKNVIGLQVNVCHESRAYFNRKVIKNFSEDIARMVAKEIKN